MEINPFKLERYYATREFNVRHNMSASDCEPLSQAELIEMADEDMRFLWDNLKLGYTETRGALLLREEIAKLYTDTSDNDLLVCTPVEGIFIAMQVILKKGDHVICTFPEYQALYEVAQSLECEVERWPADERQGWRFDPKWLEEHIRPHTRLVVVNFPHNPTGWLPEARDFKRIVAAARGVGAYLFSDEMYRFLEDEAACRLPAACDCYEKAVSLSGMSKAFGMAGVRIGWLATRDAELRNRLEAFKDYTTICSSAPSEVLSTIALRASRQIIDRNMTIIRNNLDFLDEFFDGHSSMFYWNRPLAGTIGFPRMLFDRDAAEFCEDVMQKAGVLLLPSNVFGYGGDHVRVGFGRRDLPAAVDALKNYLAATGL
ncbi:MAG TPA: aminotransferase class I/II-fold pyridoxal phosphate-dependent enzyme [Candidatus Anoxymicrobiaceae bacterium]